MFKMLYPYEYEESVFTIVSDDDELAAVSGVFENMLDDVEFV